MISEINEILVGENIVKLIKKKRKPFFQGYWLCIMNEWRKILKEIICVKMSINPEEDLTKAICDFLIMQLVFKAKCR